ncbi:hypothetical protein PAXINDRAFT_99642 [Paxillus involutus ATCC 200175]|uniref:RSE1/DDB1/CPSF1 C-terminal domain-containing protein n=1 Tax=Paxillus involutus ATCC 200175 TaxID=664439 RepID=A0A0C9SYL9_PAXIN|nr:hypothetical protein PAXINDRAFT_99642 [Paxillus involutus ATCC 200175]
MVARRAFDLDERLNPLLVGDAVKSVWLVAFQEDPYKFMILGKDIRPAYATSVDFVLANGELSIALGDDDGVLRLLTYDPSDPDRVPNITHYRAEDQDHEIPQAKLIAGALPTFLQVSPNGSLSALMPVDEDAFKRKPLQGQLSRNIQHVAGLNPRAYWIARNDIVSKPLSKCILGGQLPGTF